MSTPYPSRSASRTRVAAAGASLFAIALFVALPPKGASPPTFFEFLGRFHTLIVHLPVGVLLLVASAELLTRFPRLRQRVDPAMDLALPFLLATAVAAFSLGLLLAKGGGYPAKLVGLHRGFTLAAVLGTAGCLVAWTTRIGPDGAERRLPYRATLGATVALLTIGAHFGGSLTHGDNYLTHFAPAFVQRLLGAPPAAAPLEPVTADPGAEPLVFANTVMPLLQRQCVECHGPDKAKGGLRLDSLAAIMKGGDDGPAVEPGHGADSSLVKRMLLPASDDDHMPPAEKPQPTPGEIELLRWWIDRGANDTLKVRDALVPDGARTILGRTLDGATGPPAPGPAAPPPAPAIGVATMMPTAPSSSANPPPSVATGAEGGRLAYHDVIAPLLVNACGKCHGDAKQKGKLRVDSIAALMAGGKSGAGIVPGSGSQGTVLSRVRLPGDDDKHMPPRDEPQLTSTQVAMLAFWIARGATETLPASALPQGGTGLRPAGKPSQAEPPPSSASASSATPTPSASTPSTPSASAPSPIPVGPGPIALYRDVVAPLLARRCGECHSGQHSEGGMRVDDLAKLVTDKDLVPGKPDDSPLVKRMALPASDADRMPPPEKPPVDAWETAAVAAWITSGGSADAVVAASTLPPSVARALNLPASPAAATTTSAGGTTSEVASAPPGTVVPLRASGCGSCAVGSTPEGPTFALGLATALGLLLATRRRRARTAVSS
jgi:MYXO-CTERM domain-containing protein